MPKPTHKQASEPKLDPLRLVSAINGFRRAAEVWFAFKFGIDSSDLPAAKKPWQENLTGDLPPKPG